MRHGRLAVLVVVVSVVASVVLIVPTAIVLRASSMRRETLNLLTAISALPRLYGRHTPRAAGLSPDPPRLGADLQEQDALVRVPEVLEQYGWLDVGSILKFRGRQLVLDEVTYKFLASRPALDAWGNEIYYRCPGPVHKNGWDLISCGPNGVYAEGEGDDLVVGEDVTGGLAPIAGESAASVTSDSK